MSVLRTFCHHDSVQVDYLNYILQFETIDAALCYYTYNIPEVLYNFFRELQYTACTRRAYKRIFYSSSQCHQNCH